MNFLSIFAKLSLDSSEYERGLDDSEKDAQSFGSKLKSGLGAAAKIGAGAIAAVGTAAAAAGAVMVKEAGAVAAHGDQIDKMSQKLGLSSEAYQQWDYVLGQSGADINSMSTGMKTLTNKLDEAKNGGEDAQKMFAKLGISMDDINKMSREELFEASIKGFQGMADSTERAALANDLFGKSGQELTPLFNTSIEETEALLQASKDLGFVMSEESVKAAADYQDALDTMQRTMGGVKTSIVSDFLPSMTMVMEGLTQIFAGNSEEGGTILQKGISKAIKSIQDAIPKFLQVGKEIISALAKALMDNLPQITQGATQIVIKLATTLISNLPQLIQSAVTMIKTIAQTLISNLPQLINAGKQMITSLVGGMQPGDLIKKGGELLEKLMNKIFEYLPKLLDSGLKFVSKISEGLQKNLPTLITTAGNLLQKFLSKVLEYLPKMLESGVNFIKNMADGVGRNLPAIISAITNVLSQLLTKIMQNLPQFLQKGIDLIGQMAQGIGRNIPQIINALAKALADLLSKIAQNMPQFLQKGLELIGQIAQGIGRAVPGMINQIPGILRNIGDAFKRYDWWGLGRNIIDGIKNGLLNAGGALYNAAINVVSNAWNGMLRWLGIASPSKKAEKEIGRNWALGIGAGFEKNFPEADMIGAIDDTFEDLADLDPSVETTVTSVGGEETTGGKTFAPVFNIYGGDGQDVRELADEIMDRLTFLYNQEEAAYGLA